VIFTLLGLAKDITSAGGSHILCLVSRNMLREGQGIVPKLAAPQITSLTPKPQALLKVSAVCCGEKSKSSGRDTGRNASYQKYHWLFNNLFF